jgi:hypothetical protein
MPFTVVIRAMCAGSRAPVSAMTAWQQCRDGLSPGSDYKRCWQARRPPRAMFPPGKSETKRARRDHTGRKLIASCLNIKAARQARR